MQLIECSLIEQNSHRSQRQVTSKHDPLLKNRTPLCIMCVFLGKADLWTCVSVDSTRLWHMVVGAWVAGSYLHKEKVQVS
jgi:hypothetical protein